MVYHGKVKDGVVVFDGRKAIPEGAPVTIRKVKLSVRRATHERKRNPTLLKRYRHIVGIVEDLPPDFSENHDHYLYGTPKRK
jgi:hypothetical protein